MSLATTLLASTLLAAAPVPGDGAPFPSTLASPKVYVAPLSGQMGTDISKQLVDIIVEDVRKQKPDIIVYALKSADIDRNDYLKNDNPMEFGMPDIEKYRDMVKQLHEDLRDVPQVMWVEDSVGFASLMALGWPNLYMHSDARLWGLSKVAALAGGWQDPDVAAKMLAAWTGIGKGILQQGGYPLELGDAMIFPEKVLSVKFEGRSVLWLNDTTGNWVVDANDKDGTANFTAALAEDTGLADGNADSLEDLMFLLGYREFTKLDSGEKLCKQYVDDWRKALERCEEWMRDAAEVDGNVAGLGKRKSLYEKVVAAQKQYPAVEARMQRMGLPGRMQLELEIDNLKKEIQRAREAEKGNRGETGGGSGGGRGLGGGFGGRRGS